MNNIFIISGPSGCGKGTIIEQLLKRDDLNLYWAKSYTTRPERASDKSEHRYIFVTEEKFKELEKTGEILESNFFNNHWYGTSKSEMEKARTENKTIIKEIDVNGAFALQQMFEAKLIFITTSLDNVRARLISRGQNTDEEIKDRLNIAKQEIELSKNYDYVIDNPQGHPEQAVQEIVQIIKNA